MEHQSKNDLYLPNRLGFHYFPDAEHYSQADLEQWLPILQEMRVGWLVIRSLLSRAIPENFIRPLIDAKFNLIVDFQHPLGSSPDWESLQVLLAAYGRWGVRYALLDQAANMRTSWGNSAWGNPSLIQNYAERFIHFSGLALNHAVRPVLGPLVPGGDYWDTAFLPTTLAFIARSASPAMLSHLVLSAYGWDFGHHLDWGAGGPDKWPQTNGGQKLEKGTQNQQGFRAYEWVADASRKVFGKSLPIMLFEAGLPSRFKPEEDLSPDGTRQMAIIGLVRGRNQYDPVDTEHLLSQIPSDIISCNLFTLSATEEENQEYRWFEENGRRLPPAQAYAIREGITATKPGGVLNARQTTHPLLERYSHRRYVLILDALLPQIEQILDRLQPLIENQKPLVGFSASEASRAAMITVITPGGVVEPSLLEELGANGSLIKVISVNEIPTLVEEYTYAPA